ncbi:MAG: hypothetical protein K5649_06285, partial [Lachnospiraceae bacterium]|nr:hypothetical protein [Lachnospiraceae bacterium]
KRLVTPIEQGFEEMRAMWDAQEYDEKGFRENDPVIYTEKGERVRSKSEKILTYETEDSVINTRDVMCKLERYLL